MLDSTSGLTADATHAIQAHPHLKQHAVHVSILDGTALLTGTVNSFFEKQMAQESLRDVPGVQTIDNEIMVDWNCPSN